MKTFIIATLAGAAYAQYNVSAAVTAISTTTEYTSTPNKSATCGVAWSLNSNSSTNTSGASNAGGSYSTGDTTYTSTWEQTQTCTLSDSFYNDPTSEVEYYICLSTQFPNDPATTPYADAVFHQGCRYWKWTDNEVNYVHSQSRTGSITSTGSPITYPILDTTASFASKFTGTSSRLRWTDSTTVPDPYLTSYCNDYNTSSVPGNKKCLDWTVDTTASSAANRVSFPIVIGGITKYITPSENETTVGARASGVDLDGVKTKWSGDGRTVTAVNVGTTTSIVYGPPDAWTANQSHVRTTIPVVKMTNTLVDSGISFKVDGSWTKTKLGSQTLGVPSGVTQVDATAETSEILV